MDTTVRNVCWLKPPEPPIFKDTPQKARDGMLNFQRSCPAYNEYAKLCLGKGNETSTVSPQPTSTPSSTTLVSRVTSSPILTTEFTNISSQQNDTIIRPKPELIDLSSNSGSSYLIFVPISLTIVLLLVLVIGALWYIKRKKGSGYHLFLRVQTFLYKDPSTRRNRKSSLSSNGSKKSRNDSAASESGVPNNGSNFVITNPVSMNGKNFKHASTAQLIDETSIQSEYENPTFNSVKEENETSMVRIEMKETMEDHREISDAQRDSDAHQSSLIPPKQKTSRLSDCRDQKENYPPYDTLRKRNLKEEQGDMYEEIEGGSVKMEGGGADTSETDRAAEVLKPELNIDHNSNNEVSIINNQLS